MAVQINTSSIPVLLRDGVDFIQSNDIVRGPKSAIDKIFSKRKSHRNTEIIVETRGTGLPAFTAEGQPGYLGDMGIQTTTVVTHSKWSLGLSFTEEAMEDNLYDQEFPKISQALRESFRQNSEIQAMNIFNNAFENTSPIGDGKALCAIDHPIYNGTVSNNAGINDWNETSLQDMIILAQQMRDPAGLYRDYRPVAVLVPLQLQFVTQQILKSAHEPFSGNNAINAVEGILPKGWMDSRYLTNPGSVFLLTDYPEAFIHYEKKPLEVKVETDTITGNVNLMGSLRESFVPANFRGVIGLQGA